MYNKGDIVEITGKTVGITMSSTNRIINDWPIKPITGMIIGFTFIQYGNSLGQDDELLPVNYVNRVKVWLVEPLNNNRYLKLIRCQEHQIKKVVK